MKISFFLPMLVFVGAFFAPDETNGANKNSRPNILVVLTDDLGFSDLGCYGSEIDTPNLDRLAAGGLRFTQFYNTAKCHSSRVSLLTGRWCIQAGDKKLNRAVTIPETIQPAGYFTAMTGKWHLDKEPTDFGFQRYFGHLSGACNYFKGDKTFRLNGQSWQVPERGFYTTVADVDYALRFLNEARADKKPWFLYVAFNAPHAPLQPLEADYRKYLGRYNEGWDVMRAARLVKQKKLGLFGRDVESSDRPDHIPAWDKLTPDVRQWEARRMAAYAALIDRVDQEMGRLIEDLRKKGELDNTLILFLSDNGACPYDRTSRGQNDEPYSPTTHWSDSTGWAWARNSPFRYYKQNQYEGGITTPAIAHWPAGLKTKAGSVVHTPAHLVDVLPTLAEITGSKLPKAFLGRELTPLAGVSLAPIFADKPLPKRPPIHLLFGQDRGLRDGDWKLVSFRSQPWELYNLATDRTERNNVAGQHPEIVARMSKQWHDMTASVLRASPAAQKPVASTATEKIHREWSNYSGNNGAITSSRSTADGTRDRRKRRARKNATEATPATDINTWKQTERSPNILFILADDLGYMDVNAYAQRVTGAPAERQFYETPNIDRLIREGTAFSQAYACQLCSPTRAGVLTGRNAAKIGVTTATPGTVRTFYNQGMTPPGGYVAADAIYWGDKISIEQALLNGSTLEGLPSGQSLDQSRDEITLAEALTGYHSAFIGKWHLGGHGAKGWQPQDQGFDALAYSDEGGSPYFNWRKSWDNRKKRFPKMPQMELLAGKTDPTTDEKYLTDALTDTAVEFLRQRASEPGAKPFFLYLCHFAVHTPFHAKKEDIAHFEAKSTLGWNGHSNATYAGMVKALDNSVGRLLDTLHQTKLDTNTLVVFMSDNGGVTYTKPTATSNAPFKGGKAMHFEGGIRIPLVFHWPGRIPANQWCEVPVTYEDIFPSLLELASFKPEAHYDRIDGRSLVGLLRDPANRKDTYSRDTFYWHYPFNVIVLNPDDGQPLAPHSTIREGDWKLIFDWSGKLKLFNIAKDPFEQRDLSAIMPNKTQSLFRKLNDWLDANVATKYLPALNPDYDASNEARSRPFVDLRRQHLGEARSIRTSKKDPRFKLLQ